MAERWTIQRNQADRIRYVLGACGTEASSNRVFELSQVLTFHCAKAIRNSSLDVRSGNRRVPRKCTLRISYTACMPLTGSG